MPQRTRGRAALRIGAATALIAAVGDPAAGSLEIDVRAVSATGTTQVVNGKSIVPGGAGDVVTFDVFVLPGGVNSDPSDDGIVSFSGSYLSPNNVGDGSVRGDLLFQLNPAVFGASGTTNGLQQDLDGDGDLDLGSNDDAAGTGHVFMRAVTAPQPFPGNSIHAGTLTLSISQLLQPADRTEVNFRRRFGSTGALWRADGVVLSSNTAGYNGGNPVVISSGATGWTGAASANWSDIANWSAGSVPTAASDASFPSPAPGSGPVITLSGASTVRSLTFEDSYTLSSGTLHVAGGTLAIAGGRVVHIASTIDNGAVPLHLTGAGTLFKTSGAMHTARLLIDGGRGRLVQSDALINAGSVTVGTTTSGGTAFVDGSSFLQDSGTLLVADSMTVNRRSTFTSTGGVLTIGGEVAANAGTFTMAPDGARLLTIGRFATFNGGRLDLTDNDMRVTGSSYNVVAGQIAAARNGGAWNAAGITSSTAAANPSRVTTLGAMTGAEFRSIYGPTATFGGGPIENTDVLVRYTYYGDTDFNGLVDGDDYARLDAGFNGSLSGWINGDSDLNGSIDGDDYSLIDQAFNAQDGTIERAMSYLSGDDRNLAGMNTPALRKVVEHFGQFGVSYAQHFLASIPEPGALAGVFMLAPCLARLRRRQRRGRADRIFL
jgi:hypothetical protein